MAAMTAAGVIFMDSSTNTILDPRPTGAPAEAHLG
jgi:hypothetical protein